MSILIIISFLIHGILGGAVFLLYKKVKQEQEKTEINIKKTMNQFITEMKKENDSLEKLLLRSHNSKISQESTRRNEAETSANDLDKILSPPPLKDKQDEMNMSIQSKVFQMNQEGMSVHDIAKKLNRGKTEIELMLAWKK